MPWKWIFVFCLQWTAVLAQRKPLLFNQAPLARVEFNELFGGIVLVQASLSGHLQPINFILDTGNTGISLDSSWVAEEGIPVNKSNRFVYGIGGKRPAYFVPDRSLIFPGYQSPRMDFHLSDYRFLSNQYGVKVHGVIGFSLFKNHVVHINYDQGQLEFYLPKAYKYPKNGQVLKPQFAKFPLLSTQVHWKRMPHPQESIYDLGAALNFLMVVDSSRFVRQFGNPKRFVSKIQGIGGEKDINLRVVDKIKFGRYTFKKVPVHLYGGKELLFAGESFNSILGSDLLRRFNMVLNYSQQEVFMYPNTRYFDPFDYSYIGFNVVWMEKSFVVEHLVEGAPAALAGLKVGDKIMAINNQFFHNLDELKRVLGSGLKKVEIILQRKEELIKLQVRLEDLRK